MSRDSLAMISAQDVAGYVLAVESVLESFETREEHLEDIPSRTRSSSSRRSPRSATLAAELESALLPA